MICEAVQRVNAEFPGTVFKPGYPSGRGVYMVLDRDRAKTLDLFRRMGVEAKREPCGHDWNYGGDLYRLRLAEWLVRAKGLKGSPHNQDDKEISK